MQIAKFGETEIRAAAVGAKMWCLPARSTQSGKLLVLNLPRDRKSAFAP